MFNSSRRRTELTVTAFFVLVGLTACDRTKAAAPQAPPVPVVAALVEQKNVPIQVRAIGAVEAYSTVAVKTQITGELTGVYFKEGDDVKKGQILFTLDKRPFEAEVKKQESNLVHELCNALLVSFHSRYLFRCSLLGVASRRPFVAASRRC